MHELTPIVHQIKPLPPLPHAAPTCHANACDLQAVVPQLIQPLGSNNPFRGCLQSDGRGLKGLFHCCSYFVGLLIG